MFDQPPIQMLPHMAQSSLKSQPSVALTFKKKIKIPESKKEALNYTVAKSLADDFIPMNYIEGCGFRNIGQALINIGARYGQVDLDDLLVSRNTMKKKVSQ